MLMVIDLKCNMRFNIGWAYTLSAACVCEYNIWTYFAAMLRDWDGKVARLNGEKKNQQQEQQHRCQNDEEPENSRHEIEMVLKMNKKYYSEAY